MENKTAIAKKEALPISTKSSVEISSFIRGRNTEKAKNILKRVLEKKEAVPFKRYVRDIAHKKGNMASGKYPIKATSYFIELIELAEANARQKGLVSPFKIIHIGANKGSKTWHSGRFRRMAAKRTHLEIKIQEEKKKETTKKQPKTEIKEKPKEIKQTPKKELSAPPTPAKEQPKKQPEKVPTAAELKSKIEIKEKPKEMKPKEEKITKTAESKIEIKEKTDKK